ncbi:hypothetical protein PFISCL1PPCAC_28501, partial [Pristionchus fissidentatus]
TLSCTNSFKRPYLMSYEDGKYVIAAHGPFIELYDIDKFESGEYDLATHRPVRTRAFQRHNVAFIAHWNKTGHVIVFNTEYVKSKLVVQACIVHRDKLLSGGYVDPKTVHVILNNTAKSCMCSIATIKDTFEVLLLTDSSITHLRYVYNDDPIFNIEIIAEFQLREIMPPSYAHRLIFPFCVTSSAQYAFYWRSRSNSKEERKPLCC